MSCLSQNSFSVVLSSSVKSRLTMSRDLPPSPKEKAKPSPLGKVAKSGLKVCFLTDEVLNLPILYAILSWRGGPPAFYFAR